MESELKQRWYDLDPTMSLAVSLMHDAAPEQQSECAKMIIQKAKDFNIHIHQKKLEEAFNYFKSNTFLEEEIVPNLEIQMTNDGKIFMKNIINKLKYLGYPTVGALFSIYIKTAEDYVYIG